MRRLSPPRRTENRACSGEAANLPRLRNALAGDGGGEGQASKPPNFQASTNDEGVSDL